LKASSKDVNVAAYIDVETPNYIKIYDNTTVVNNINHTTTATYLNTTGAAITTGTVFSTSGAPYYTPTATHAPLISHLPLYHIGTDSGGQGLTGATGPSSIYNPGYFSGYVYYPTKEQVAEQRRQLKQLELRSHLIIQIKSRAPSARVIQDNERVAMETLRETVTEEEYRRYLKYGFIMVKGKSGDEYQIFRNKSHTRVWRNGLVVEEICVRIRDNAVPPTDNVIAFRAMALIDEQEFKKSGNVYKMIKAA
jgi:hypothetical protein